MNKKIIIFIGGLFLTVLASQVAQATTDSAENVGKFLNINPAVTSSAKGGAGVAEYGGADFVYNNPASPAMEAGCNTQIITSYTGWISETNLMNIFLLQRLNGKSNFGLGIRSFSSGDMSEYDVNGKETGDSINFRNYVFQGYYNNKLNNRLSLGGSVKFILLDYITNAGSIIAADGGLLFRLNNKVGVGLSFKNIATALEIANKKYDLQKEINAGLIFNAVQG
nr:hypothetical protein [Elusimicrobiota bacterium]